MKYRSIRNMDRLYDAARPKTMTKNVEHILKPIIMKKLSNMKLTSEESKTEAFLEGTRMISDRLIGNKVRHIARLSSLNAPQNIIEHETGNFERRMDHVREALMVCLRSKHPGNYAMFMVRKGLNIIDFLDTMPFFIERKIELDEISDEKKESRAELLRLAKAHDNNGLRKLVDFMQRVFPDNYEENSYEMAAAITGLIPEIKEMIAGDFPNEPGLSEFVFEKDHAIEKYEILFRLREIGLFTDIRMNDELILFDKLFYAGPITVYVAKDGGSMINFGIRGFAVDTETLIDSPSVWLVQHELQHIFDNVVRFEAYGEGEFRAMLAQMLFSSDFSYEYYRLILHRHISEEHEQARTKIIRKVGITNSASTLAHRAKNLLNEEYRKVCGLTYEEILDPFRKSGAA